jgi:cytolysin (calcineurin-like family phosphatase)
MLRVAAADSRDPSIEYHYAVALARTGAKDEARRRLSDLLGRAPGFAEAPEARALLDSLPAG